MGWEAWVTLATVVLLLWALAKNLAGADVILMGGALLLTTLSLVSAKFPGVKQLAASFGNEGVLTVGVLFVVAAGLTETGGMALITERLLGYPSTVASAQLRMMTPVMAISAFLNNTPVVAMFIPAINEWCKKTGISPSKLFMPLSYVAVLGGVCTLIGTSTNLVVQALMVEARKTDPSMPVMGMFTITPVGIPLAIVGVAYIVLTSKWLLPERKSLRSSAGESRKYTVEMQVEPGSVLEGQTIEGAGLRRLPGMFLSAIERDNETIVAVEPDQKLHGNDRLVFVGVVDSVVDLQRIRGLKPATDEVFKMTASRLNRLLVEVVISDSSPFVGKTIREGAFRTRYNAAVIAVYRNGERLVGKIGDIELKPGDALLLQAHANFVPRHRNNHEFLLVSPIADSRPVRHERAWLALGIMGAMVLFASTESLTGVSVFHAALVAAGAMGLSGCISADQARKSLEMSTLLAIIAALVVGQAMERTGLAGTLAGGLVSSFTAYGPWAVLAAVYFLTLVFTELVTNNAAAALAFPIAKAAALGMGVSFMPFALAIAVAASCGFATPLGYQTHLMVYGPGGYRFSDFLKAGIPLDLLCMAVTIIVTPIFYPF